jgi:hypothetical protein
MFDKVAYKHMINNKGTDHYPESHLQLFNDSKGVSQFGKRLSNFDSTEASSGSAISEASLFNTGHDIFLLAHRSTNANETTLREQIDKCSAPVLEL